MRNSLAVRLVLSLTLLVGAVQVGFSCVNVTIQEQQLQDEMVLGADQLSNSIISATWHAMLQDRRETAYEIMENIGKKQGIRNIRFFNKEGRVTFSTSPGAGAQVDTRAEACVLCHADRRPLVRVDMPSRTRVFRDPSGRRVLGMISPIYNEAACSQAACHAHAADKQVLGVLDITLDLDHVDRKLFAVKVRSLLMTVTHVLVVAIFIVLFTRHFVTKPINRLIAGTREISAMSLDKPIKTESMTELRELAASFETMRVRLKLALDELNALTVDLEQKVEERGAQLLVARQRLLQSDRLASLGQLAASVAHEINNPVSGVLNLSMLMQRILKDDGIPPGRIPEYRRYLTQVINETTRVGRIVSDLLSFSRRSRPQTTCSNLNTIVATTVQLISHTLLLVNVKVELQLAEELPEIPCDRSQIQQVIINLIMNAAEAMPKGGTVSVRTSRDDASDEVVRLDVEDRGAGIAPEHLARIFDPFFTTKEEGKGVGLGLAVVYGIVDAHKGTIDVKSSPGAGTVFRVVLPVRVEAGSLPNLNAGGAKAATVPGAAASEPGG
jgi:two-component system NtrC family sensor kinase